MLRRLRWRLARSAGSDDVDDVVQEAALAAWRCQVRGEAIVDRFAFCVRVAQRRIVDERRTRRPVPCGDVDEAAAAEVHGAHIDWVARLHREGLQPRDAWIELLDAIGSGARATKHLARVLARDAKTVRCTRRRLQRWLVERRAELAGTAAAAPASPAGARPPNSDLQVGVGRARVAP
ncbi:MAG: sigma-70 family RNA polymerase sigma factor [Planctomycetes bacterium]|nr:sigma-70 family RNA polymerase sigma factor [Planctomycetota bacterium]